MLGVYFNLSLLVLRIFLSFLLSSLCYKVASFVAYSLLQLLVCLLSFLVASERGSDFVNESVFLGYVERAQRGAEREAALRVRFGNSPGSGSWML